MVIIISIICYYLYCCSYEALFGVTFQFQHRHNCAFRQCISERIPLQSVSSKQKDTVQHPSTKDSHLILNCNFILFIIFYVLQGGYSC
jgi:hypothetical protein